MWRLEPEGEAERAEATVPWNETEGFSVNPEGEGRYEQVRAKTRRKERENQANMEEKVDGDAPSEDGAEIQSPKRKVIRVEPEETQDYVRDALNLSRTKQKKQVSCQARSASHKGPCFGVTLNALTKPSDSGSLLR